MEPADIHPETLEEKPPVVIANLITNVTEFVAGHGWLLLGFTLACALVWSKLRPTLDQWLERRERDREAALHHKDPERFRTRQLAVEVSRQRLQARHEAQAAVAAQQASEREEQRRQERLARLGGATGHRLAGPRSDSDPPAGHRPPPRSCPGGGCSCGE